jgi:hypothetical protein
MCEELTQQSLKIS